jgi:mannose-1-phosphate guanylyltransferase
MAFIRGKPFIEWIVLMLRLQGVRRVVICTGHLAETLVSYFGNGEGVGMEVKYVRDPFPLGTGGAVRNALGATKSKNVLVLNGDSYLRVNLSKLLKVHLAVDASASVGLVQVEDSGRYGSVKVNRQGEVVSFLEKKEKKQPGLVNAGIYLLHRRVIKEIPEGKNVSLERDVFPNLIGKGLYGVVFDGPFIDIGTPESFNEAEIVLKKEFEYLSEGEDYDY